MRNRAFRGRITVGILGTIILFPISVSEAIPKHHKPRHTSQQTEHSKSENQDSGTLAPLPPFPSIWFPQQSAPQIIEIIRDEKPKEGAQCAKGENWREVLLFYWCTIWAYITPEQMTALFTVILGISTIALWWSTKAAIKVASDGVEVARKTYVAEHRTWLKVYPTEIGPVTFDGDRIRVNITIEAENIGSSPAIAVNLDCKPYRGRGFVVSGSACKNLIAEKKAFASLTKSGMILMTSEKHSCRFAADAETDATTEAKTKEQEAFGVPPANLKVTLSVVCCVIYKSLASDDWHHTGHVIWLRKKDRSGFDAAFGDVTGDNIKVTMPQSESSVA
jgi:hypothetical protein